jgi:hypothetical protein
MGGISVPLIASPTRDGHQTGSAGAAIQCVGSSRSRFQRTLNVGASHQEVGSLAPSSYVHRTVALADALRAMGCAPGTLNPAAVEAVAEALGDAAESVREHWREAFRLAHPGGDA